MCELSVNAQITFVYTSNLARSASFYEGVLGLDLAVDQGSCRIYRVVDRQAYLGVCQREGAPENVSDLIITLVTSDVDGWYERIMASGWRCDHRPRQNDTYKIYHFFTRDPDGYLIEIQRFDRADWDQA